MTVIDGALLAQNIKSEIAAEVEQLLAAGRKRPHLAAVLVGENPASEAYVGNKIKSCAQVGFESTLIRRPLDAPENELLEIIKGLNEDPSVDGFIVQLPLPKHISEEKLLLAIDPKKDVDGFHPINFGRMAQGLPCYLPATPFGILEMLRRYNIPTAGKKCVVVGRSNIVGTPMAILMSRKGYPGDATVTLAHSRTADLKSVTLEADILIAAIGIAHFITGDMVKTGAVVIDVGMNRIEDLTRKSGSRLVGDVDFATVSEKSSFITPVPGGVGQMTVVALMLNTLKAAKQEIYA